MFPEKSVNRPGLLYGSFLLWITEWNLGMTACPFGGIIISGCILEKDPKTDPEKVRAGGADGSRIWNEHPDQTKFTDILREICTV